MNENLVKPRDTEWCCVRLHSSWTPLRVEFLRFIVLDTLCVEFSRFVEFLDTLCVKFLGLWRRNAMVKELIRCKISRGENRRGGKERKKE